MSEKTFIKGKDRDLESTIATMHSKLEALGIDVEEASWLNPVPHVHSVHVRDRECSLMFTNGKGASSKACLASALGEYFERLSCNYFFADYYLGEEISKGEFVHYPNEKWFDSKHEEMPAGLLDEELWDYYDPECELQPSNIFDTNSGAGERGICALPYKRQRDGRTIWFPVNIIANIYVSNGMAAGNTRDEARVQALSEIYERYVKNKIFSEGICLPEIPKKVVASFPHIQEAVESLQAHGYHLRIADASLGGIYPVISVTLINPENGSVLASFGAHPSFEVALERTVTELLQGRGLDMLDDFHSPSFNLDEVADPHNLEAHFINSTGLIAYEFFKETPDYEFVHWDHDSDMHTEFTYLRNIAEDAGYDIYISDYEHLGVYACRIIVPGLSDIYPIEDLQWSNNNEGALYREAILSLRDLSPQQWEDIAEALEDEQYQDMQKVAEFIGIAPDAGTLWANLQVGELKAMLFLASKEYESALEWTNWCLYIGQLDDERRLHYKCLHALLEIVLDNAKDLGEYASSLDLMYGKERVETCSRIIKGEEVFYGLNSPGLSLEGFERHNKLLEGYKKLHKAKQQYWEKGEKAHG